MSLSLSPLWTYPVDHSVDYSRYGMTRHDIWNYLMSNLHNIESYNRLRYLNSHKDTLLPSQEPRLNMKVVQIVEVGEKTSTITTNSGWSHQLCWLLGPWPTWPPKNPHPLRVEDRAVAVSRSWGTVSSHWLPSPDLRAAKPSSSHWLVNTCDPKNMRCWRFSSFRLCPKKKGPTRQSEVIAMTVLGACVICKAERFYGNLPQKTDRVHSKIHQ